MIDLQADLAAVFYGPDDESVTELVLQRPGQPDQAFRGRITVADLDQLDHRATSSTHILRYPTAAAALEEGDELHAADGTRYRLLQSPRRVADGHESEALISPLS